MLIPSLSGRMEGEHEGSIALLDTNTSKASYYAFFLVHAPNQSLNPSV